ncbi:MAG: heparan-alpha-glucosaminide N-acetyltransferase domain-containing protein [Promethearchaeota archaeon]
MEVKRITQRIKSIDIFRGLCMVWMIANHLIAWWLNRDYLWIHKLAIMIIDPIGVSGFLFISGVSIAISYRRRMRKTKISEDYNYRMIRTSHLLRALLLFIVAISYNVPITVWSHDPKMLWSWFVLQTAAISLFLTWPFLKSHKLFRIIIATLIIIFQQFVIILLRPYQGDSNLLGALFHLLYNPKDQDPILVFFPFFLIGTIIGDIIYKTIYERNDDIHNIKIIKKHIFNVLKIGMFLIALGVLLSFAKFLAGFEKFLTRKKLLFSLTDINFYGSYLDRQTLSWIIYSLGIDLVLLSILLLCEFSERFKVKKSYKFIFYYSYYSLTIYLAHNIFFFLFLNQLDPIIFSFVGVIAFISMGVVLRGIYKIWGWRASIKAIISKLSQFLTLKIEVRKERNIKRESLKKIL